MSEHRWTPAQVAEALTQIDGGYHDGLEAYVDAGYTRKPGGVILGIVGLTSADPDPSARVAEYFAVTITRTAAS